MIDRYTRPTMGQIWSTENKFEKLLQVEKTVALVQGELGLIPKEAAQFIHRKGKFKLERILEIEKITKHDVVAFVKNVAEEVEPYGRFVHFGLTSSDVLDTSLSLQIIEGCNELCNTLQTLIKTLDNQIEKHSETLCAGRTHGMHAEPTSFGLKLLGFKLELLRNLKRIEQAQAQNAIGKLSGAVGTYSFLTEEVERQVCKKLFLQPEIVATQVIPRDRHAEMIISLAFLGSGLERLSIELRHLQRTEVSEVTEGFSKGQTGSSAMPHKKNPISSENITGISRLLRNYGQAALENISLWHERDISHSSVERVIFPDAFILADYATHRMSWIIENLEVDINKMKENMKLSQGQLFSSHILLELVSKGLPREKAYELIQRLSHSLKPGEQLEDLLQNDTEAKQWLHKKEIENLFSGKKHQIAIRNLIKRVTKKIQNPHPTIISKRSRS